MIIKNTILIPFSCEITSFFDLTNNVQLWPELFEEYTKVEIIEKKENYYKFRLYTLHEGQEISWISERTMDYHNFVTLGQRISPMFPFSKMNLKWEYLQTKNGIEMTWIQNFEISNQIGECQKEKLVNHLKETLPLEMKNLTNNAYNKITATKN